MPGRRGRPRRQGHASSTSWTRRPAELAERYAREGADELVFLDIGGARGRGTLLEIVERTARQAFIPLTVGGGVRSVDEMRDVLRAGADKVSLNTAAVADPDLVTACARKFGSQAVVVAIDARMTMSGSWEVVVKGGREAAGLDAVDWAERVASIGAGELLVTSIDRDMRPVRLRHRAAAGDHVSCDRAGDRLRRCVRPARLRPRGCRRRGQRRARSVGVPPSPPFHRRGQGGNGGGRPVGPAIAA